MSLRSSLYGDDELSGVERTLLRLAMDSKHAHVHDQVCNASPDYCISRIVEAVQAYLTEVERTRGGE